MREIFYKNKKNKNLQKEADLFDNCSERESIQLKKKKQKKKKKKKKMKKREGKRSNAANIRLNQMRWLKQYAWVVCNNIS